MDNNLYKVLVGDPFGGYEIVERGLSKEDADSLKIKLRCEVDYFTSVLIKPDNDEF